MSAEQPPVQNVDHQAPVGETPKGRGLIGGTLHEIRTDPGFIRHAKLVGAEMLAGAGVLAETSHGKRFSFSGFADALSHPKEAFKGAMTQGAPHAARLAGHAALVGVGHLSNRRADGMTMRGESHKPASQA